MQATGDNNVWSVAPLVKMAEGKVAPAEDGDTISHGETQSLKELEEVEEVEILQGLTDKQGKEAPPDGMAEAKVAPAVAFDITSDPETLKQSDGIEEVEPLKESDGERAEEVKESGVVKYPFLHWLVNDFFDVRKAPTYEKWSPSLVVKAVLCVILTLVIPCCLCIGVFGGIVLQPTETDVQWDYGGHWRFYVFTMPLILVLAQVPLCITGPMAVDQVTQWRMLGGLLSCSYIQTIAIYCVLFAIFGQLVPMGTVFCALQVPLNVAVWVRLSAPKDGIVRRFRVFLRLFLVVTAEVTVYVTMCIYVIGFALLKDYGAAQIVLIILWNGFVFVAKQVLLHIHHGLCTEQSVLPGSLWIENSADVFMTFAFPFMGSSSVMVLFVCAQLIPNIFYVITLSERWYRIRLALIKKGGRLGFLVRQVFSTNIQTLESYRRRVSVIFFFNVISQFSSALMYMMFVPFIRSISPNRIYYPFAYFDDAAFNTTLIFSACIVAGGIVCMFGLWALVWRLFKCDYLLYGVTGILQNWFCCGCLQLNSLVMVQSILLKHCRIWWLLMDHSFSEGEAGSSWAFSGSWAASS